MPQRHTSVEDAPLGGAPRTGAPRADRLRVLGGGVVGAAGVLYGATCWDAALAQQAHLQPWWTPAVAALVGGALLALATLGLSGRGSVTAVRAAATVVAVGGLLAVVTFPAAMTRPTLPPGQAPWPFNVVGVTGVAAAVAWPRPLAVSHVAVVSGAWIRTRWLTAGRDELVTAVQDAVVILTHGLVMAAVVWMVLRGARLRDAAADAERTGLALEAAEEERRRERTRLGAVVHDTVLAALHTALTNPAAAPGEARRALAALDDLGRHRPGPTEVGTAELARALRAQVPAGVEVVGRTEPATVPREVARALLGAAGEAVRNSLRHAGPGARCRVAVTGGTAGVTVTVTDDGPGFADGPGDRLGIRASIVGRMESVPGGYAAVASAPRRGTTVTVGWRP